MTRRELARLIENPGAGSRIIPFEGVRGYAVLLVFLVHHHTLFSQFFRPSSILFDLSQLAHDIGQSGVDMFFVLSGFLIYGHWLQKAPRYLPYLRKRIRRIYPTFLFVFCIYVTLSISFPSISRLPHPAFREIVYLVENLLFLPGIFPIEPLITVSWSLSYEFFFYLSIPILIDMTRMRRWRYSFRIAFFIILLLVHAIGYSFGLLPHIRLSLFVVGILLYEVTSVGWPSGYPLSRRGEALIVGCYAVALLAPDLVEFRDTGVAFRFHLLDLSSSFRTCILFVALFGLTLYAITFRGAVQRFFSSRPLCWLGNMSYTYFLCHGPILYGSALVFSRIHREGWRMNAPAFLIVLGSNLVFTLAGSRLVFVWVEKPFSLAARNPPISRFPSPDPPPPPQARKEIPALL